MSIGKVHKHMALFSSNRLFYVATVVLPTSREISPSDQVQFR